VQYLAGELAVEAGMVLPLRAAHNTMAMRFDIEVHTTRFVMHVRVTVGRFPGSDVA
jgi:hypothetical protein